MKKYNVGILGASGYTGAEAVRFVLAHPKLKIKTLTANRHAGKPMAAVYPHLAYQDLPDLQKWQDVDWSHNDIVFACLPHGASQETIAAIKDDVGKVIDLSADFRIRDPKLYAQIYDRTHDQTDLLKSAAYGLTEVNRSAIKKADLVACPGCYPTCSLLPLLPILDLIENGSIVIDAKSGVSGAGRKESQALIFPETAEGAHAYGVATHRHAPEIDQALSLKSGTPVNVSFTPHLIPMNRGMISTTYVKLNDGVNAHDLRAALCQAYQHEPFVHIEEQGLIPQTRHVRGSNQCRIGVFADRRPGHAILISVIDNLAKGSSGQAVQNLNVMMGWEETLGLTAIPLFP